MYLIASSKKNRTIFIGFIEEQSGDRIWETMEIFRNKKSGGLC